MQVLYLRGVFAKQFDETTINWVMLRLITKYIHSQFVKLMARSCKYLLRIKNHISLFKGNTIALAFFIALALLSCKDKNEAVDAPPVIAFEGYRTIKNKDGKDSLLMIKLFYKDVNGDIGLTLDDTMAPFNQGLFNYNLWVDIFDADNGGEDTIKVFGLNVPQLFHQRIPDLRPTGKSKYIEGTIDIGFEASKLTLYPTKIKVYLQMLDRKLQKSNKIDAGFIYLEH